jgi:hypothetical protein
MSTQEEEEELFYKLSVCSKMGFFSFLPDLSLCAFNNLSPSENKIDFDFGRVFFFFFFCLLLEVPTSCFVIYSN